MEMRWVLTVAATLKKETIYWEAHMPRRIGCLQTVHEAQKSSWELSTEKKLKLILVISHSGHIHPSHFSWNIMSQTLWIPITSPLVILPMHRGARVPRSQPCNGSDDNTIIESSCLQKPPVDSIVFIPCKGRIRTDNSLKMVMQAPLDIFCQREIIISLLEVS